MCCEFIMSVYTYDGGDCNLLWPNVLDQGSDYYYFFFGIVDIMNFREGRLLGGLLLCRTGCVMSWDCLCKIGWYDHGCLLGLASQC